jgi:sugar/nucleoside kinase (ribokinase family)
VVTPPLICVVGDSTLDVTVQPDGPMLPGGDRRASITTGAGGQGANVAVRLVRRGARVRLVTMIGPDAAGEVIRSALSREAVELADHVADRSSAVVALVGPDGDRSMFSDRLALRGPFAEQLEGADWVHCSGYALRDPAEAAHVVGEIQKAAVPHLSVAGGSFEGPGHAATVRAALASLPVDLLIMSRSEANQLGGDGTLAAITIITKGLAGSTAIGGAAMDPVKVPAVVMPNAAVDTTGAGDAYAAELIRILVEVWPPSPHQLRSAMEAASLAGAGAARVIGSLGVIPDEQPAPVT